MKLFTLQKEKIKENGPTLLEKGHHIFFAEKKCGDRSTARRAGLSLMGFSLVELLVAVSVFIVIVTFSLGSILGIMDAGRKSRSLSSVMTNLNFAVEVMAKEIKFGKNYSCLYGGTAPNCSAGGTGISFVTSDGVATIYQLGSGGTANQILKSTDGGATFIGVTAPEVNIQSLKFYVFGAMPQPDNLQPRVILIIRGFAGASAKPSLQSSFALQTTVSQRVIDR